MGKLRVLQRKLGFLSLPLYFCILVCLDLSFRALYQTGAFSWQDGMPLLFTLGWALLMTGIAGLLPRRGGRIWMVATCTLFGVLVVVHCVMFNLFGKVFSLQDVLYAGEGARFFSLRYIQVRKAMVLCVILAVLGSIVAAWLLRKKESKKERWFCALPGVLGLALILTMHFSLVTDQVNEVMTWSVVVYNDEELSQKILYTEFNNPNAGMAMTGLYHYTVRNTAVTVNPFQLRDEAQARQALDAYYGRQEKATSDVAGILKGKNLIMVMLESIDSFLLTPSYMPNLYAVQQESVDFINSYTPLYLTAGTFGTEFLSQTGLIPPQSGVSTNVYVDNAFPTALPQLFRAAGYSANSFHAASGAIYNRGKIHRNLGFEAYHSYTDMGMEDYMLDSQMLNGFDLMVSENPFYSYIITYSGHGPYDGSAPNISGPHLEAAEAAVAASGITGSAENMQELTLAVAHAMETDAFIGRLMRMLEEGGYLEDTAVIFYADHYCKYMTDPGFLMELKGVDKRNMLCQTPFFIYSQDLEPKKMENLVSSVDIYPTVCSLFGLNTDLRYYMGNDAFDGEDHLVYWPDYSWYDGQQYFDGGTAATTEAEAETIAWVKERLNMAWNTLIYDYFRQK